MNKKIIKITISFLIGLIGGLYFSQNIVPFFMCLLLVLGMIFFSILKKKFVIVVCLLICINTFLYSYSTKYRYTKIQNLYSNDAVGNDNVETKNTTENQSIIEKKHQVIGVIVEGPVKKDYYSQYVISIEKIDSKDGFLSSNFKVMLYVSESSKLNYGDEIYFKSELELPEIARNYKGFNYRQYLLSKNVVFIANVNQKNIKVIQNNKINLYSKLLHRIKNSIENKIDSIYSKEIADFMKSIFLGESANLNEEISEDFSETNLSYLLAISGMHVNYIIIIVAFANNILTGKRKGYYFTIVILIIYFGIVGGTTVVRAVIMAVLMIISKLTYRHYDAITILCVALIGVLLKNPYSIYCASCVLTFTAVFSIIISQDYIKNRIPYKIQNNKLLNNVIQSFFLSISINLFLFPILIIYYHKISFSFIIIGVFINYLFSLVFIIGVCVLMISFINIAVARFVSIIFINLYQLLIGIVKNVADWNVLKMWICTPSIFFFIVYYMIVLIIILTKNVKRKIIKKIVMLIIVIYSVISMCCNLLGKFNCDLRIYFVDVGQGDCCLIVTPDKKTILIDGGGNEQDVDSIGKNTLVPYLLSRGVKTIDYMVVSHFDTDHFGGLQFVAKNLKVKNLVIGIQYEESENYNEMMQIVKERNISTHCVSAGNKVNFGKYVSFSVLWPCSNFSISENKINNNALVGKLCYGNFSMLFTGDIEEEAENAMIELYKSTDILKSTILKVAHHGSKSSSTQKFLNEVTPQIALIGVGKNNTYGHPSSDVIDRLENMQIKIYRTDLCGEISVTVNNRGKIRASEFLK